LRGLIHSGLARDCSPLQPEATEVFPKPVGIVGRCLSGAGLIEEHATCIGEGAALPIGFDDLLKLDAVEVVEGCELRLIEQPNQCITAIQ
jgi:hypothetical protein